MLETETTLEREATETKETRRFFVRLKPGKAMAMMNVLENPGKLYFSRTQPNVIAGELTENDQAELAKRGAEIIPARRYQPLLTQPSTMYNPLATHPKGLDDVLDHIRARQAWSVARGAGVHVAIVDTGVCGSMKEFAGAKQSAHSWGADPWLDGVGHGSMTACIATASHAQGGQFDGVAPDATLISCRTSFDETELFEIYEHLIGLVETKTIGRLVVNNSYGMYQCGPAPIPPNDVFINVVREAVGKGIVVVFAAGNNHVVICGHDPSGCSDNSIWGANSLDEVLSVGTVNEDNRMDQPPLNPGGFSHRDSSRGPGQLAVKTIKPDCVAPTYGNVIWGCGTSAMEWWGTSGAAPQVAGFAALLLSKDPFMTVADLYDTIRKSCRDIGLTPTCGGSGLIDCGRAFGV
jgi:subtilisin family serine protease